MAYSTSTPPALMAGFTHDMAKVWVHQSADAAAAADTAGFITNGDALGMKVGDIVWHRNTATGIVTLHAVQSVTAGGSIDLFDAGATITADTD